VQQHGIAQPARALIDPAQRQPQQESEKKLHPLAYLANVVNEEFGLKGQCVKVIQY
jgi:hypothetical protein